MSKIDLTSLRAADQATTELHRQIEEHAGAMEAALRGKFARKLSFRTVPERFKITSIRLLGGHLWLSGPTITATGKEHARSETRCRADNPTLEVADTLAEIAS